MVNFGVDVFGISTLIKTKNAPSLVKLNVHLASFRKYNLLVINFYIVVFLLGTLFHRSVCFPPITLHELNLPFFFEGN